MPTSKSGNTAGKTAAITGRQEITRAIASKAGLTQKKAAEVLEATLAAIEDSLQKGNEVRLVGFGSFKVRRSAARKGVRDPRSGPTPPGGREGPGALLAWQRPGRRRLKEIGHLNRGRAGFGSLSRLLLFSLPLTSHPLGLVIAL